LPAISIKMAMLLRVLGAAVLVALMLTLHGCGDDSEETPAAQEDAFLKPKNATFQEPSKVVVATTSPVSTTSTTSSTSSTTSTTTTTTTTTEMPECDGLPYLLDNTKTGMKYFGDGCDEAAVPDSQGKCAFGSLAAAELFCSNHTLCVGVEVVSEFGMPGGSVYPMKGEELRPWREPWCSKGQQCKSFLVKPTSHICVAFAYPKVDRRGTMHFSQNCGKDSREDARGHCFFDTVQLAQAFCDQSAECVGMHVISQSGKAVYPMQGELWPWSQSHCSPGEECHEFLVKSDCKETIVTDFPTCRQA